MGSLKLFYINHNMTSRAAEIEPQEIPFYDLTILLRGHLSYTVDGRELALSASDVIFMPPGSVRQRDESEEGVDYVSFNFFSDEPISLPLCLHGAAWGEITLLIAAVDMILRADYLNNMEKNTHLLACLLSVLKDRVTAEHFSPLTRSVMEYVHAHFAERISLADIGRHTFFSPIYCETVFKRETGQSIIDYLLEKRIDEAKRLLLEGTRSLSSVAEEVGFFDYNYFSRVFKKRTGYTPRAYRRFVVDEFRSR